MGRERESEIPGESERKRWRERESRSTLQQETSPSAVLDSKKELKVKCVVDRK